MSAPNYNLNADEAREGSGSTGGRIDTTGDYIGILTKAKHIEARTGALGVEFEFESKEGLNARFSLYTQSKDGDAIYGAKQLQALMAVLKLRSLSAKQATIEEYDFDTRGKVKVQAEIYPELMNKPVGIIFQMEEYLASDGQVKSIPKFFAPFDPSTRQTAMEVLDQKQASSLDKLLLSIKDKKLSSSSMPAVHGGSEQSYQAANAAPDLDSDIPF